MALKRRDVTRLIGLVEPLHAHLCKAVVDCDEIVAKRAAASVEEQAVIDAFVAPAALVTLRGRLVTARDAIATRVDALNDAAAV